MNPDSHDPLEASLHRVLRSVPDRRAPAGLESRVLAEIARRAALPWWKKSFAHWPQSVRAAFFVVSAVCAGLLVSALILLFHNYGAQVTPAALGQRFGWLILARELFASAQLRITTLGSSVSAVWLYSIGIFVAAAYGLLVAIGAATYRALHSASASL